MITTYLLKNCKYCKKLLEYLNDNPNVNICLIMISKKEIPYIKYQEPRIQEFPVAFSGSPKVNGMPHKKSKMIPGSENILQTFKNKFGNSNNKPLRGSNIDIDYQNDNAGNIHSLNNIRRHRNNCFGKTCHIMDRPYGPTDNQYILQGYQPSCAIPIRSDLPIKQSNSKFGITTPGTKAWKLQRHAWPCPTKLINDSNCLQNMYANKYAKLNVPQTYSNDYLNQQLYYNKFGNKFVHAPVNSTMPFFMPFLTYAAGGDTISRITGKNYLPEQIPIQRHPKSAFISGNIKKYAQKHSKSQNLLSNGLNSKWSINAQGIYKFGNIIPKPGPPRIPVKQIDSKLYSISNNGNMVQTTFDSSGGASGIAQNFYKFPNNGNVFGKTNKSKSASKSGTNKSSKQNKFATYTSPLGIEIKFKKK